MIEEQHIETVQSPSKAAIAKATAIALLVAAVLLITAVLPAEYGIDPLGTGKALHLTDLAKADVAKIAESPTPPASVKTGEAQPTIAPVLEPAPDGSAPTMKGTFIAQPNRYKIDSREIKLKPGEGMEIKYNMKKGAGLIYSWVASEKLLFEFHGEPNVKPAGKQGTDYYETYEIDNQVGKDQAHGTFIAPSSGVHGWFWENKSANEVTLKLVSAGFYDWIFQNRNDKESALKTMDPDSIPGHPKIPDEVIH
ncbi:MAG: hypothetical protein DMG14_28620 [Acidobacteria bacterium]|nr:MAG: hypothetical protein DMG14_28620 [Acidobacteriota bacterium]